jgi:hypothetical protein
MSPMAGRIAGEQFGMPILEVLSRDDRAEITIIELKHRINITSSNFDMGVAWLKENKLVKDGKRPGTLSLGKAEP